jgi:hypothetical protein
MFLQLCCATNLAAVSLVFIAASITSKILGVEGRQVQWMVPLPFWLGVFNFFLNGVGAFTVVFRDLGDACPELQQSAASSSKFYFTCVAIVGVVGAGIMLVLALVVLPAMQDGLIPKRTARGKKEKKDM